MGTLIDTKRKPEWLKITLRVTSRYKEIRELVKGLSLHTVCQEARCPNIFECWGEYGTATFMILGDTCTRKCAFCAVKTGLPSTVDPFEPLHVAEAVKIMKLKHVVITSVDRDDLPDGGALHFAKVVEMVHSRSPFTSVEILTPDFRGVDDALDIVLAAKPEVFSHNLEMVPRLYPTMRLGSSYDRSIKLLENAAIRKGRGEYKGTVKTGIMVGIGERPAEVFDLIDDIVDVGVEILTIGQYLQPTPLHAPVDRWVPLEEFEEYRRYAMGKGIVYCEAGPLVRSSYHAHEHVGRDIR